MPTFEGFIGPTYVSQSIQADGERCINLYPEVVESGAGKSKLVFYPTAGVVPWQTLADAPIRALWAGENRAFAIGEKKLYEITGSPTLIGTIDTATSTPTTPAGIFSNGSQLFTVSGQKGYVATGTGAPVHVIDGVMGAYLDGYFIVLHEDSNQFELSELMNGLSWPGDFGTKLKAPDRLRAIFADHGELWLLGDETTEVWHDTGGTIDDPFPLAPIPGAFIEHGILAPWSVVRLDDSLFWLGKDSTGGAVVWRSKGWVPQRVSNHAVEQAFQTFMLNLDPPGISDAVAYGQQYHGHSFYVLNFPTADRTWVYDVQSNMWHERIRYGPPPYTGPQHGQGYRTHAFVSDRYHIVGSDSSGYIYREVQDHYEDIDAHNMWRIRSAPHICTEQKPNFYHSFQLDMEVGGNGIPVGADPQIMLEVSNDGGFNFQPPRVISASQVGQTKYRAIWRRCGRARDRVFRVSMNEAIPIAWMAAYLEVTQGA